MSEEIANQSEESPIEVERDADTEALYESFGMPAQKAEKKDVEFPKMDEPTEALTMEEEEEEIQDEKPTPEKRTIKVKYLGEDKEVDEEEAPTWIQKGMNHDRLQEKLAEQQQALDRVAKVQGYKDHAELMANLDKIEQERVQQQVDQFEALKQQVIDDLVYNGVSEEAAKQYAENNPLVQQARAAVEKDQQAEQIRAKQSSEQQWKSDWKQLYDTFPDAGEGAKAFTEGKNPDWYTPEMKSMIDRGYKPIDAYKLAHGDKISAQTRKSTEQKLIKQQQLGVRAQVDPNTATPPDEASILPVQIGLAEEFGVSVKGVQRQNQLIKSRR